MSVAREGEIGSCLEFGYEEEVFLTTPTVPQIPESWEHHGRMWPVLILLKVNRYVRDVLEEKSASQLLAKNIRAVVGEAKRSWQGVSGARPNGEFGRGRETGQPTLRPGKRTR